MHTCIYTCIHSSHTHTRTHTHMHTLFFKPWSFPIDTFDYHSQQIYGRQPIPRLMAEPEDWRFRLRVGSLGVFGRLWLPCPSGDKTPRKLNKNSQINPNRAAGTVEGRMEVSYRFDMKTYKDPSFEKHVGLLAPNVGPQLLYFLRLGSRSCQLRPAAISGTAWGLASAETCN